ncbi:MAG: NusG domain II-containing protein [Erysipelotrichaceae bacterium]|nr:NusG domain II-containing protein [Erysipelotrichaceae bacterium]
MRSNKKYKADIIFLAVIVLLAVVLILNMYLNKEKGALVEVRVEGEIVETHLLTEEGQYDLNDGTNILVIKDGYAYLIDADCPDKLCVNQGKIQNNGEIITCLPNRLTVTVNGGENDVDFIS